MTAFKARETVKVLRTPAPEFQAFLLYGPDEGLTGDRTRTLVQNLAKATDPEGEILRLNDRDFADNPNLLQIEARTMPMFGQPKIIRATVTAKIKPDNLEELLSAPMEARIVLSAGNLKPTSKIRKLFEKTNRAAALPCYADGQRDLDLLIEEEITGHGFDLPREVREILHSLLEDDIGAARSELQKLALYAGGNATEPDPQSGRLSISIADVTNIVGDQSAPSLDELITAVMLGPAKQALALFERQLAMGTTCQTVLILLVRHLNRLHQVQSIASSGVNIDSAMKSLRPPVFFKQADAFKSQCRAWTLGALTGALNRTHQTMQKTRRTPKLEIELTTHTLLQLAGRNK